MLLRALYGKGVQEMADNCAKESGFVRRWIFLDENEIGKVLHDPETNELREMSDGADLEKIVDLKVSVRFG